MPTSDASGQLVFHHVNEGGQEYGGPCIHLFFLIPIGPGCSTPEYKVRFLRNGKVVDEVRYMELNVDAWRAGDKGEANKIAKKWQFPEDHHSRAGTTLDAHFRVVRKTVTVNGE